MRYVLLETLIFISIFRAAGEVYAQSNTLGDVASVTVYPIIEVVVNKTIVVQLPRKAAKVAVTQPQIAEVVVVAPDQLLINGKALGATSLVVWYEQKSRKQ
ncbi:MAG TPA: pilus assembly protein N-terminal domain-containing protein [Candidatus Binatia bacterium]|nr:pilus assembly protein N-terminal domain-containing protein [Candidatus Binatia bacterium]